MRAGHRSIVTPPERLQLYDAAISQQSAAAASMQLKAIADPVRLRIVSLLATHADEEMCAGDLGASFDLSKSTMSHHLKKLHVAGILSRDQRGVGLFYRLNHPVWSELVDFVVGLATVRTNVADELRPAEDEDGYSRG